MSKKDQKGAELSKEEQKGAKMVNKLLDAVLTKRLLSHQSCGIGKSKSREKSKNRKKSEFIFY